MGEVVSIDAQINIAETLRSIADGIESGDYDGKTATLILDEKVFSMGKATDEMKAQQVIWDCTYAIQLLMSAAIKEA